MDDGSALACRLAKKCGVGEVCKRTFKIRMPHSEDAPSIEDMARLSSNGGIQAVVEACFGTALHRTPSQARLAAKLETCMTSKGFIRLASAFLSVPREEIDMVTEIQSAVDILTLFN